MLASDSTLWCSLLRRRHGELLGDADPYQTLLSQRQDCREKTCSSPMQKPMHRTQLLQAYEREWQFTKAEPVMA